jgi:uncharacterized PurR-regulated membrane protein YhhQ (DUF165 family)
MAHSHDDAHGQHDGKALGVLLMIDLAGILSSAVLAAWRVRSAQGEGERRDAGLIGLSAAVGFAAWSLPSFAVLRTVRWGRRRGARRLVWAGFVLNTTGSVATGLAAVRAGGYSSAAAGTAAVNAVGGAALSAGYLRLLRARP